MFEVDFILGMRSAGLRPQCPQPISSRGRINKRQVDSFEAPPARILDIVVAGATHA
jgi:hypothetical protein